MKTLSLAAFAALFLLAGIAGASAHPHVWVTSKSELVYSPDGRLKQIRHAWTFDDMFSAFASQGLDKNGDGKFSRDELADLAKTNVESLKEFGYFTVSKKGEKPLEFEDPVDYYLEADDKGILTLHFTLPVKGQGPKGNMTLQVYDPTYFVAFSFADEKPVTLTGAPAGCSAATKGPDDSSSQGNTPESFFAQLNAGSSYGEMFANNIMVRCQ
ncbi:MAG TPA: DUF1007 family protein [Xanthobacteraceae bacterium]|nr:DUF1007 family protein [Xanthobacteraceae bacterium]